MRKLYGDSLRNDAGFVKVMKKVAKKNAHLLETRAGRHAPKIKRVAKEVRGKFEKVYEETADAFEEFLSKCECFLKSNHEINNWILNFLFLLFISFTSASENLGSCTGGEGPSAIERTARHHVRLIPLLLLIIHSPVEIDIDSRVANDLTSYDTAKYKLSIVPSEEGSSRFHLGEPIRVKWHAPANHSRKDWIGIYRVRSITFIFH